MALAGDATAMRVCLDRIVAPRKDRPVKIELPVLKTPADTITAIAAITTAASSGELTPSEAGDMTRMVDAFVRATELTDLERRLAKLEETAGGRI